MRCGNWAIFEKQNLFLEPLQATYILLKLLFQFCVMFLKEFLQNCRKLIILQKIDLFWFSFLFSKSEVFLTYSFWCIQKVFDANRSHWEHNLFRKNLKNSSPPDFAFSFFEYDCFYAHYMEVKRKPKTKNFSIPAAVKLSNISFLKIEKFVETFRKIRLETSNLFTVSW